MSVIKNISAIAQGMTITLKEMFQPTIVENYPDGPGPLKGARRKRAGKVCSLFPLCRRLPRELHLHRSRGKRR